MKKLIAITLSLLFLAGCAQAATGDSVKTGLGVVTSIAKSSDAAADKDGNAQVDSTIAAVTVDANGKILKTFLDVAQTKIPFNATGVVTADKTAEQKTKQELGDGYGMRSRSAIGKEWFEQANALADWTVGKTVDEVSGMTLKTTEGGEVTPDVPELTSSVTITVTELQAAIVKAVANAK